ncbi:hypothetical protein SCA6_000255 [Theobroma cacao]
MIVWVLSCQCSCSAVNTDKYIDFHDFALASRVQEYAVVIISLLFSPQKWLKLKIAGFRTVARGDASDGFMHTVCRSKRCTSLVRAIAIV